MHLIYSALRDPGIPGTDKLTHLNKTRMRYKAYKAVCEKYRHEIAAIQKYLPNWKPRFDQ